MSCYNPKPAYLIPAATKTGRKVKFITHAEEGDYKRLKEKYGDDYIEIPCGKCLACIEQRTKTWAIRCTLEAAQYENNAFLTLTYNNNCLPKNGVCKTDVFKFIKRLRNRFGSGIRYFGCAEYGSLGRAHYHAILFNFWPDDAVVCKYDPVTETRYYKSKSLQELWPFGFVSLGDVSYNSCAYVARYCQKKLVQELGVLNQNFEFSFMSRRPGIGEVYFRDHFQSLMETDTIYAHIGDKFKFSSIRYFDKLIERINPDKLQELKSQRIRSGTLNVANELLARNFDAMQDYLVYQDKLYAEKYNRLRRRID